jgi:hypothetical protein
MNLLEQYRIEGEAWDVTCDSQYTSYRWYAALLEMNFSSHVTSQASPSMRYCSNKFMILARQIYNSTYISVTLEKCDIITLYNMILNLNIIRDAIHTELLHDTVHVMESQVKVIT